MNIILAIILLSIIILVHEFGHFILAKASGVTVVEFCLGFGPKLIHFKKGETDYSIKLLPFGGACIMLGEDFDVNDDDYSKEEKADGKKVSLNNGTSDSAKTLKQEYDMSKSFANKSVWARISILAAGPIFNFLLAFIFAVIIIGFLGVDPPRIDKVSADSPAATAGLLEGDQISSINGRNITFSREVALYETLYPQKTLNIGYTRNGEKFSTVVEPEHTKNSSYKVGVYISEDCVISQVSNRSPAKKAGMKINDKVKAVDGQIIGSREEFTKLISAGEGKTVALTVERDGKDVVMNLTPEFSETDSYFTGFASYGEREHTSPAGTLYYGVKEVGYWIRSVFDSLGLMVSGKVSLNDVAGPVGVVNVIGNVVEQSKPEGNLYILLNLFNMAVMISANLGVMNLLPLPALDGGRLVFCILEALRGKPVAKEKEGMVHFVGMVLLMILMVLVLFNDIKNIFM